MSKFNTLVVNKDEMVMEGETSSVPVWESTEDNPVPVGYQILIALPPKLNMEKVGSLFVPDDVRDREHTASIVGQVLAMGPDCYSDKTKFPGDTWCKVGDWVIFRSYAGTRFVMNKQEFRLLNDDTVQAVVGNPRLIERAV